MNAPHPNPPPLRGGGSPLAKISTLSHIRSCVAAEFGVEVRELLSDRRANRVAVPRHVAMYLARRATGYSLPQIGRDFGRDHTTVMHACAHVEALAARDAAFAAQVERLRQALAGEDEAATPVEQAIDDLIDEFRAVLRQRMRQDAVGTLQVLCAALRYLGDKR